MADGIKSTPRRRRPARSPEERENQLTELAVDLVEKQLVEGTVSAAVLTQLLRRATQRDKLELERIRVQTELDVAKRDNIGSDKDSDTIALAAIAAISTYHTGVDPEEEEEFED